MVRLVRWLLVAVVLVALASCGWFRLSGGRWERVETPSMGTAAPVGTLLWVRPVGAGGVRAGEIVSFHRPGGGPVYSHRVTRVNPDGSFDTAGDLSGPDRWRVAPGDVVGRVVRVWPGIGRLVQAAPLLLLGVMLTGAVVSRVRRDRRLPLAMVGASLTLTAALVVYHPLTGAESLGFQPLAAGARATYVSTGLLPIRVTAPGIDGIVLHAGESGSVVVRASASGRLATGVAPVVPWWWWPAILASCFGPAVADTLGRRRRHRHQ